MSVQPLLPMADLASAPAAFIDRWNELSGATMRIDHTIYSARFGWWFVLHVSGYGQTFLDWRHDPRVQAERLFARTRPS